MEHHSLQSSIMKKISTLQLLFLLLSIKLVAQTPIEVVDNTIKVAAFGDETFYYGFAEGDQLIFNFQELNGKELKEVEILELPGSSKFMDYKTKRIQNKTIHINRPAIYKFRFSNAAMGGRVCKIQIHRIPASQATTKFNTSVYWRTLYDTTYTAREETYFIHTDTSIISVMDQKAKVSSSNALNGNPNKTVVDFSLPDGTIAWSYYIGVGREGQDAYNQTQTQFVTSAAYKSSSFTGLNPLAALALFGLNAFIKAQGGDNVKYWFISDWNNVLAFRNGIQFYQYKHGDVINDAAKMDVPKAGKVYLGLLNDNVIDAIEVDVKVSAVVVKNQFGNRTVQDMKINRSEQAYLQN
jgi:hypothetical protein